MNPKTEIQRTVSAITNTITKNDPLPEITDEQLFELIMFDGAFWSVEQPHGGLFFRVEGVVDSTGLGFVIHKQGWGEGYRTLIVRTYSEVRDVYEQTFSKR